QRILLSKQFEQYLLIGNHGILYFGNGVLSYSSSFLNVQCLYFVNLSSLIQCDL
ncbi:2450_t:CDS:1, partial [Racocetra persica]